MNDYEGFDPDLAYEAQCEDRECGLPNLDYPQLDIVFDKSMNEVILFDLEDCNELIRVDNTVQNVMLLKSFAYVMDNQVRYRSGQAFEEGRKEGYRKRSLEIKWALENLMKVD